MLAALAGVVHHRQRAHGDKHNRDEDNDYGALHGVLLEIDVGAGAPPSFYKSQPRVT